MMKMERNFLENMEKSLKRSIIIYLMINLDYLLQVVMKLKRMTIRYIFVALILMIFIVDTLALIRKGIVLTVN